MIKVNHLSKIFHNPDGSTVEVLKDVNCEIQPGEVVSIIGPSGTGKSTFLRALNMLDPPTGGEIWIDGENIMQKGYPLDKLRRKMGMVFQSFNLFPHMTILENVTFAPIKLLNKPAEEANEEALSLLKKVGMAHKANVFPSQLSGGQKQRVAIARALAMKPEAILFDEPTSALDPTMVGEVLSVIRQLAKEGMTMLIVTHEMKFARDVSTRIFFMNEGIIYEDGTPDQIFNNPIRSATKAFVQRIHKQVFEVSTESPDFDPYEMGTEMARFCMKYGIPQYGESASVVLREMLRCLLPDYRDITVRLTYGEIKNVAALDFMIKDLAHSPITPEMDLSMIKEYSKEIIEEPTKLGFRVKVIL